MTYTRQGLADWMLSELGSPNATALGMTADDFLPVADDVAHFLGLSDVGGVDDDLAMRNVARCLMWERIQSRVSLAYDTRRGDGGLSRSQMHAQAALNVGTFCSTIGGLQGKYDPDGKVVGGNLVRQVVHRYVPRRFRASRW